MGETLGDTPFLCHPLAAVHLCVRPAGRMAPVTASVWAPQTLLSSKEVSPTSCCSPDLLHVTCHFSRHGERGPCPAQSHQDSQAHLSGASVSVSKVCGVCVCSACTVYVSGGCMCICECIQGVRVQGVYRVCMCVCASVCMGCVCGQCVSMNVGCM